MAPSSALPSDAVEQVRKMRELELEVLAAVDKVSGGSVSSAGSTSRVGVDARARDPAMAARVGMSRLRRELQELEGIAEDQERPSDRAAALDALAERVESHDSIRQIFRDALLRASRADERDEADERAELLGDAVDAPDGAAVPPPRDEAGALALASEATESLRRSRARMAEELDKGRRTLAAMAQSRAAMKKTGDEYAGNQRAALRGGGKLLARLERQAVTERLVLWGGSRVSCWPARTLRSSERPCSCDSTRYGGYDTPPFERRRKRRRRGKRRRERSRTTAGAPRRPR